MLILVVRFGWVQWRTGRLLRLAQAFSPASLPVDMEELCRRAGVRGKVPLLASAAVSSPAVWGVIRPRLILPPDSAQRLAPQQLTWLLLHELAHIRRRDLWVAALQRVLQIIYFFNPAVWLASWVIDQQREYACDDAALANSECPRRDCGKAFLSIVEQTSDLSVCGASALGLLNSRVSVRRRLVRILDKHRPVRSRLSLGAALLLLTVAAMVLPCVQAQDKDLNTSRETSTTQPEASRDSDHVGSDAAQSDVDPKALLAVTIRCDAKVLKAGDEIPIAFVITNNGPDDYKYQDRLGDRSGRMQEYILTAMDEQGTAVPDTRAKGPFGTGGGGSVPATLAPGRSFTKTVTLNRWVLVTQPGKYQVVGVYDPEKGPMLTRGVGPGPTRSAPIAITLEPRTEEEMVEYVTQLRTKLAATPTSGNERLELIRKLMYTCDPRAVLVLIDELYNTWDPAAFWAREAFFCYLPHDRSTTDALLSAAASRGMATEMARLLEVLGCSPDRIKPFIEVSLSPQHPDAWNEGVRAAMQYPDDQFVPRLIAITMDARAERRAGKRNRRPGLESHRRRGCRIEETAERPRSGNAQEN